MRDLIDDAEGTLVGQRPPARRRSRRAPVLWVLLATVAAVAVLGGARYAVPVETRAHQATAGPFHVALKGPGTLEARRHTVLSTTVQGRLEALPFDVGDHVEAGTPVARLEDNEARIDLGQATEEARATVHQIAEAEAQLRREEATLMRYERDLARQAELRARGVIADGAHDIARAERDAAVARVAEARARIERLRAELAVATHQVERREEAVTQTLVTAPFDAVVVAKAREIGDVVTPGTAILEIVDPATLILSARLDESEMARVEQGQAALVRFESEPARAHRATVHRIGREVDRETREFSVELTLASLPKNWALGQRGSAEIRVASRSEAVTVPAAAVRRRNGAFGVWALQEGRARWRPLEFGATADGTVEVLAGIERGDTVLDGKTLYEGMRVQALP